MLLTPMITLILYLFAIAPCELAVGNDRLFQTYFYVILLHTRATCKSLLYNVVLFEKQITAVVESDGTVADASTLAIFDLCNCKSYYFIVLWNQKFGSNFFDFG